MSKLRIGIIGLGTVGSGVYKTLQEMDDIEIVKIAVNYSSITANFLTWLN